MGIDDARPPKAIGGCASRRYFADGQAVGFTAVRLAVVWAAHIADPPTHHVNASALDRIAAITDAALDAVLALVLDNRPGP